MPDPHRSACRRLLGLATAALLAVPLVGPTPAGAAEPALDFVRRIDGLSQPTQVTSAKDGSGRLFVTEKSGRVRVVVDGKLLARPFLDISRRVRTDGEGGLLSIAFHPAYEQKPYVWAAYTNTSGDLRVARFRARSPRSNRVQASSYRRVIDVPHPDQFSNHYGGQLVFGPRGRLFLSTGDGGGGGDPANRAQDRTSLQGKILRLTVIGARKTCGRVYCIPSTNPYAGKKPGRGEIWVVGVRNAWRFSFDGATGDLWVGDVGQDRFEEIDRIPAGTAGANLGWSCREATAVYEQWRCRSTARYLDPEWSYGRDYGGSVTGGFVYRGLKFADQVGGDYVGGDFISGRVFTGTTTGLTTFARLDGVTSFGEDDDRELWAVTIDGGLYEMAAR
jgi:glucose/arabinose dehydrogenase